MSFYLNGTELQDPNSFVESNVVIGDYVTTLSGNKRRAIHAKKKMWTLSYGLLTESNYNTIKTIYDLNASVSFANSSLNPAISATVHVDINDRSYVSGTGEFISAIDLVLMEE